MSCRRARDRGATLVEAAFAIPFFFFTVLALIDFGLAGLNDNQAGNAARDGARVGIINFIDRSTGTPVGADENKTNASFQAIKGAIQQNLPGLVLDDDDVTVDCVRPDDNEVACTSARVDIDRIRVAVEWEREYATPIPRLLGFRSAKVDGVARMVLVGTPTAGATPPASGCNVTSITASRAQVALEDPEPAKLSEDVTFTVASTGTCNLTVTLQPPGRSEFTICTGTCASATYVGSSDAFWTVGLAEAKVTGGSVTRFTSFDVVAPPPCNVNLGDVSPDPVQRWTTGPSANTLTSNLSIPISATGDCDTLTVTMQAPGGGSRQICGPSAACATTLAYASNADSFWTAPGTGQVVVDGGANTPLSDTFTVTDSAACAVTGFTTNPSPVRRSGNDQLPNPRGGGARLTVTLSTSGPCTNLAVRVTPAGQSVPFTLTRSGAPGWVYEYNGAEKVWDSSPASLVVSGDAGFTGTFVVEPPE